MERRAILIGLLVFLFIYVDCDARKSIRRGGSSSGWGFKSSSKSRTTPRSHVTQHNVQQSHGSQPGKIGWNPPEANKPRPSAPVNDHVSKTSATSVQSGYPGGIHQPYGHGQPYNPSGGHNYNPSVGGHQPYNPSYSGGSYNPTYGGHSYNPSMGHGYNPSPMGGHGYNPSVGQPQQVVVQSQPYKPGIGQIAKEAFVYAGVSAGVNAAVNRIIPGGIYGGHGHGSSSGAVPVSNTQITYNNYYNNGSDPSQGTANPNTQGNPAPVEQNANAQAAAPAQAVAPAPTNPDGTNPPAQPQGNDNTKPQENAQQNIPSPSGYVISNDDLHKLSEDLYTKDKNNAFQHISMNLQSQKTDGSTTDDALEPLLTVKSEAYEMPTIKSVLSLHDNYELDVKTKENVTPEDRKEESDLLDAFLATDVMTTSMKYLADKGYIANDEYEFKDTLKRIWFSQFKRIDGEPSSSGFETVYLAEQFDSEIIGLHNWIYYAKQEEAKKLNYLGYIKKVDLGTNGAVVKLRSKLNDVIQPVTTIFVGTSPELEMALYTLCFYIRPNNVCPISLGGTQFMIVANRVNYFGKDILVSAFPEI